MNPRKSVRALLLILLAPLAATCSEDKSFVVVSVFSRGHAIPNVAQLRVTATAGQNQEYTQEFLYPEKPRAETALLQLDTATPITFSVSFRSTLKGEVAFDVEPLDTAQTVLGSGTSAPQPLSVGQVTYSTVYVSPTCDPMVPATSCGANETCAVMCDLKSRPQSVCFSAGTNGPGESCTALTDCVSGTECFGSQSNACSIKVCRKFCNSDTDCGTGSACNIGVSCSATSTQTHLCSRPCNPTGDATDGCAAGLLCFIYTGEITDCACRDASRVGEVGTVCKTDEDCQPGLMCVNRGGAAGACQTICQLGTTCPSGTTCTQLTNPVYRVFGACL